MEKTITLEDDPIFRRAVRLVDNMAYHSGVDTINDSTRLRAGAVMERIESLWRRRKLDDTDLLIISMRQRSPMPTWREMGAALHMTKQAVNFRAQKIKKSIEQGLSRDF